jgi:protein-S-isoprenylcysteine O-methyltransferase Ste14
MRWLARILVALGALFCLSALLPADIGSLQLLWPFAPRPAWNSGAPRLVFLTLAFAGATGFGLAFAGLVEHRRPHRIWFVLVIVAMAASTLLSLGSGHGPAALPLIVNVVLTWGLLRGHWANAGGARPALPDTTRAVHPLLYVPVPWVFVLGYLAGLALQRLIGAPQPAPGLRTALWLAGVTLVVLGTALAAWSLSIFHRSKTTTVPLVAPSTVVTHGPYGLSRNPMYVSLTLIYLGECAIFGQLWPFVMLLPTLLFVNGVVVPFEEAQLRAAFGDRYGDYCATVRRWL